MQKSEIADNQQVRPVSEFELGYIAGLLDGEGSIYVKAWLQRKKDIRIEPCICLVSNTNRDMIETAKNIYERLGIAFYIESRELKKKSKDGIRYQGVWSFYVRGIKRVKRVLDIFLPLLVAKKPQAELLLQWCERRIAVPQKGGIYWKYTQKDIDLAQQIKDLNATRSKYSLFRPSLKLVNLND